MEIEAKVTVTFDGGQVTFQGTSVAALNQFTAMAQAIAKGTTAPRVRGPNKPKAPPPPPVVEAVAAAPEPKPEPATKPAKAKVEPRAPKPEKHAEPAPKNGAPTSKYVEALNKCGTLMEVAKCMRAHGVSDAGMVEECDRLRDQVHALSVVRAGAFSERIPRVLLRIAEIDAAGEDVPDEAS